MENKKKDPFEGAIELNWPGKHCKLEFFDGKWRLVPFGKIETKRALLFDRTIGSEEKILGYVLKGDAMSTLEAFRPYATNGVQFAYFDSLRLNMFATIAEAGYGTATWLSLIQQVAGQTIPLLSRTVFLQFTRMRQLLITQEWCLMRYSDKHIMLAHLHGRSSILLRTISTYQQI